MIRMIQSSSASHAKAYFSDALLKSDYYLNDQELQGQFFGRLTDRLNLEKNASKDSFFALCENRIPHTEKRLTPITRDDRTTGYDINFHCPKSVSIVHALSKDDHIIETFRESVLKTMNEIEADSKTRVRKDGKYEDRETGELIWADFTHQTARPVDGSAPDPHLHSHCFVFNATWDDKEKQIKAGQFRDINRDMPYYQAIFHKHLSDGLMDKGYQIRRTEKSFELVGVPQDVIDMFSKRTDEIGQFAKEKGITDAKEKSELGARTRSKKQKGMTMGELKAEWRSQIRELPNEGKSDTDQPVRYAPAKAKSDLKPEECINHAIDHSFERVSVMPERRLLETAFRHSLGNRSASIQDITKQLSDDSRIIHVKEKYLTYCTTREVLKEEKRMVDLARQGKGKFKPLYEKAPKLSCKDQQARAIEHILTTKNQVSIVRGAAGTGKTTLMKEAVSLIEKAGKKVTVVAPTAQASRGVLAEEGFSNADTVAKLLIDEKIQKDLYQQVLWVDEAGLLGTKDMNALLALASRENARLILGGDTRQHASVVRGDALRILNTVGGIRAAEVDKIYRQKNIEYRSAVEDLSKGKIKDAFDRLDSLGSIQSVSPLKPNDALVEDYVEAVKKGKTALVISPTHKQGEEVTDHIRKKLRTSGLIGKKEIAATKLSNLNFTEAQKSDWRNFQEGQVIKFNQNVTGIKRGSMWTVAEASKDGIQIFDQNGDKRIVPNEKSAAFDIYKKSEIGLSKGDKINITRNGFDEQKKRLDNGQSLVVASVSKKGKIILTNRESTTTYVLNKDFGHINHAHCITSHSSQGKTVDQVFISQPASTFPATDAKQFYVSVSRGRDSAKIYTDDKEALLQYASELGDRHSAIELVTRSNRHDRHVEQNQRNFYEAEKTTEQQSKETIIHHRNKDRDYEPGI
jgi:conjugative relaxase-like TrwC/TraI family protein